MESSFDESRRSHQRGGFPPAVNGELHRRTKSTKRACPASAFDVSAFHLLSSSPPVFIRPSSASPASSCRNLILLDCAQTRANANLQRLHQPRRTALQEDPWPL